MRKFFALFCIGALALASCEEKADPQPQPKPEPVLNLTSDATMEFAADGGAGVIIYTLENAKEGVSIAATCDAAWVTDLTAGDTVTFNVAANDLEETRSTKIKVSYDTKEFEVTVNQAAKQGEKPDPGIEYDVEFTAAVLNGYYYGNMYSPTYNYYIQLSDVGVISDNQIYNNSNVYFIDIYSNVAVGNGETVLPLGTYTWSDSSNYAANTFEQEYSYYIKANDEGIEFMRTVVGGTVTVTENHIDAVLEVDTPNGVEVHHVVYDGSLLLGYPEEELEPISTLESDLNISVTGGVIEGVNLGDEEGVGADYGLLYMYENLNVEEEAISGHCFMLELLLDQNNFEGRYISLDESDAYAGTFLPGTYEYDEESIYPYNCWYFEYDENLGPIGMAPITSGSITVEDNGDDTMTVTFDVYDDSNNKIIGTFSGTAMISDSSETFKASIQRASNPTVAKKSIVTSVVVR